MTLLRNAFKRRRTKFVWFGIIEREKDDIQSGVPHTWLPLKMSAEDKTTAQKTFSEIFICKHEFALHNRFPIALKN